MAPFMQNGNGTGEPYLSTTTAPPKSKTNTLTSLLGEINRDLVSQAGRIIPDLRTIQGLIQTFSNGGLIDDKKYLIENIVQVTSSLPNNSTARSKITDTFVSTLWNNLQHPPLAHLGDEYRYRQADGSCNNIMYPHLGAGGSNYARSVIPQHPRPAVLPDPGLVFDTLLARKGPARAHPTKISSNLFYLGTVIIHDLFHTDEKNGTRLKNSSYLDLGPLYGHNQAEQDRVRAFSDGLLKPDTFAEKRFLSQPPGVCALMIAFNRFHNYVVGELALINEAGRFSSPSELGLEEGTAEFATAMTKRDNDLFQTGRLVTCALYVNIILNDYLRTILNLNDNPVDSDWKLDPRKTLAVFDHDGLPRGIGNQVSAEFNMIYRWHAAISNEDEAWANELSATIFGPGVDPSKLSVERYLTGLRQFLEKTVPGEPSAWTFSNLKRDQTGRFADEDLVTMLQDGCAFGARNIPKVLKAVEMLGIQQGREWGLATLNELRTFFKLKPHSTFEDVNSDPSVAEALEALYGHPDNIELYVGVQAEEAKKPFYPGSGLCPGFTISVAILSDAVALVRGDRFYTIDYNPVNLTNFGFNAAESDFDVANGGVMYKLLMRAFPGWYQPNSVYALYPFTTPEGNCEIFTKYGRAETLDFKRPSYIRPPVPVTTWKGVVDLLDDQKHFHVPWGPHTFQLTQHDYMLSGDSTANANQRTFVLERLYRPSDGLEQVQRFYESTTADLIRRNSRKLGNSYQIDIVRDVGNLAHAYFCAEFFNMPLKGSYSSPTDAYTAKELSDALFELFGYVFLDVDPPQSYKNRIVATRATERMGEVMTKALAESSGYIFSHPSRIFGSKSSLPGFGPQLVKRLREGGKTVEEAVWTIIPTAAAACATQAQGWAQMLELYFSDKYFDHWPAICKLARSDDPGAFEKLKKYALEGFRLSTPAFGVLRTAVDNVTIKDGTTKKTVGTGDTIFADFITAGLDSSKFPDPEEIRLDRPMEVYIHHGWGPHSCLGRAIVTIAGACVLRALGRLRNVRRAPGPSGEMKNKMVNGAFKMYLPEDGSEWTPFPCKLTWADKKLIFDSLEG
ncbi:heme peroxidase [Aspergillus cavernicola]|uniref:Heme peroxidase n=1 Tax=Aspergillus cavernicola TaxID=176166 RepID=A0ABR4IFW6_9EURO